MAERRPENDIELKDLKRGIQSGFSSFGIAFFKALRFILKRAVTLIILLLGGIGIGLIWQQISDTPKKVELLVKLNVGSTAYVYHALENFDQYSDFPHIKSLEIEPVVDLSEILEKFKVLDDEQIITFLDEISSSKPLLESEALRSNYELHKIELHVDPNADVQDATAIVDFISESTYYKNYLSEIQQLNKDQLRSNTFAIAQIDSLLLNLNRNLKEDKSGTAYTNYEDFDLASLLFTKDSIFKKNKLLIAQNNVGSCVVCIVNNPKITENKNIFHYKAIWLPVLLILGYLFLSIVLRFYHQTALRIDE